MFRRLCIRVLRRLAQWADHAADNLTRCPTCGGNPYRDPPCVKPSHPKA